MALRALALALLARACSAQTPPLRVDLVVAYHGEGAAAHEGVVATVALLRHALVQRHGAVLNVSVVLKGDVDAPQLAGVPHTLARLPNFGREGTRVPGRAGALVFAAPRLAARPRSDPCRRTGYAYCWWLMDRYDSLPDYVVFTQAKARRRRAAQRNTRSPALPAPLTCPPQPNAFRAWPHLLSTFRPGHTAALSLAVASPCGCDGCYVEGRMARVRELFAMATHTLCHGNFRAFLKGQFLVHKSSLLRQPVGLYRLMFDLLQAPPGHWIHDDVAITMYLGKARAGLAHTSCMHAHLCAVAVGDAATHFLSRFRM